MKNIGYRYRKKLGLTRTDLVKLFQGIVRGDARLVAIKAKLEALEAYSTKKNHKIESLQEYVERNRSKIERLKQAAKERHGKLTALQTSHKLKVEALRKMAQERRGKYEALQSLYRTKIDALKESAVQRHQKLQQIQRFYRAARTYFALYFQGFLAEAVARRSEELKSECYIALLPNSLPAAYELRRLNGEGTVFCDNVENVDVHRRSAAPRWSPVTLGMVNHAAYGAMMDADGLLTIGDALAKTLTRFGPPVHVVKNFREYATTERNSELREMCSISDDATLLFASGNVVIGFEPVMQALAALPESYHLAAFVRLKPVEYHQRILTLIEELGIADRVHLFEFVNYERLAHLAAGADIGLITSDIANPNGAVGLPNRCFDYIAAGLPVVAPAMPDVKALVDTYGFGRILDSTTAESWIECILDVNAKINEYRSKSDYARSALTWESQEDALYKFLGEPKSVTLIAFRDLTRYQRYKRLSRTLISRGCRVKAAFVSIDPDLDHLVSGVEYYVTGERHFVDVGLQKL
ncbi:glycosyltransferase [Pseudomonas guariconensis]|uniref:glycosyltransferase n=1 Tax=Pseudomonas guariconensis TaxID=1288410 RepID=UPI003F8E001A